MKEGDKKTEGDGAYTIRERSEKERQIVRGKK